MDQKTAVKKCLCDNSNYAKCLGSNCKDKNCPVQTKEQKEIWRTRWEGVK